MRRPKHGKPPLPASSHSAPRGKLPPLKHTLRYIDPATVLAEKYPSDRSPDDSSGTEGEEDKKKELPVIDLAVLCEGAKEMKPSTLAQALDFVQIPSPRKLVHRSSQTAGDENDEDWEVVELPGRDGGLGKD